MESERERRKNKIDDSLTREDKRETRSCLISFALAIRIYSEFLLIIYSIENLSFFFLSFALDSSVKTRRDIRNFLFSSFTFPNYFQSISHSVIRFDFIQLEFFDSPYFFFYFFACFLLICSPLFFIFLYLYYLFIVPFVVNLLATNWLVIGMKTIEKNFTF